MKNNRLLYALPALLSAAVFFSCQKTDIPGDDPLSDDSEKLELNLVGVFDELDADAGTKATALPVFRIDWWGGETVTAYSWNGSRLGTLTATVVPGTNGREATLKGTISNPSAGKIFLIYSYFTPTNDSNIIRFDLSSLKSDYTPFVAYSVLDAGGTKDGLKVSFTLATSVLKVNVTGLPAGAEISSAYITNIENICQLSLSNTSSTVNVYGRTGTTSTITHSFATTKTASDEGKATIYFCIPKISAAEERKLKICVSSSYYCDYCVVPSAHEAGSYVNTICEVRLPDYIDENGCDRGDGVYVPGTGLVWAPVNCGYIGNLYNSGRFYQWGRRFGQGVSDSDSSCPSTADATLVKGKRTLQAGNYQDNSNKFFYGNNTWCSTSASSSDKWFDTYNPCPEGWRLPTCDEFGRLIQNRSSLQRQNSSYGYWFTGSNSYASASYDQKIFLPLLGYRLASTGVVSYSDTKGMYWTSDADDAENAYALLLQYNMSPANGYSISRGHGCSIRCVQK